MPRRAQQALLLVFGLLMTAAYIGFAWQYTTSLADTRSVTLKAHAEQLAGMLSMLSLSESTVSMPYTFGRLEPHVSILAEEKNVRLTLPAGSGKPPLLSRAQAFFLPEDARGSAWDTRRISLSTPVDGFMLLPLPPGCDVLEQDARSVERLAHAYEEQGKRLDVRIPPDTPLRADRVALVIPMSTHDTCIIPPARSVTLIPLPRETAQRLGFETYTLIPLAPE